MTDAKKVQRYVVEDDRKSMPLLHRLWMLWRASGRAGSMHNVVSGRHPVRSRAQARALRISSQHRHRTWARSRKAVANIPPQRAAMRQHRVNPAVIRAAAGTVSAHCPPAGSRARSPRPAGGAVLKAARAPRAFLAHQSRRPFKLRARPLRLKVPYRREALRLKGGLLWCAEPFGGASLWPDRALVTPTW